MKQTTSMWMAPRTVDAAGGSLCIVVTIAAYVLAIGPLVEKRISIVSQRRELKGQKQKCAELGASVTNLENRLETLEEQLANGQIRLESSKTTNERIAKLAGLFGNYGLEIDDVKIGDLLPSMRCTVVPISIAGRGGYQKSVTLLHELNRTFADTSVAKFELSGSPAGSELSSRFRLDLLWYTMPELQAARR